MTTFEPCYCEGPWADIAPENRPETVLEREHVLGSIVNDRARCDYADAHQPTRDPDGSDNCAECGAAVRQDRPGRGLEHVR